MFCLHSLHRISSDSKYEFCCFQSHTHTDMRCIDIACSVEDGKSYILYCNFKSKNWFGTVTMMCFIAGTSQMLYQVANQLVEGASHFWTEEWIEWRMCACQNERFTEKRMELKRYCSWNKHECWVFSLHTWTKAMNPGNDPKQFVGG